MKELLLQKKSLQALWLDEGERKKWIRKALFFALVFCIFAFVCQVMLANDFGLGIDSMLEKYVMLIVKIFRWVTALAIFVTLFLFFQGRPIWVPAAGAIIVSAIIANINKILDALNLTGGFVF